MSGAFTLALDTRAPQITWGPPDGADAGEELTVPYVLDEPDLESAEIELGDGRVLPMELRPGVLAVTLPFDTPDGPTTVRAYVRDSVWNEATRTLTVMVGGVPVEPPPVPAGLPSPPQRTVRRISDVSVGTLSADDVVRAISPSITRATVRSRYLAPDQRILRSVTRGRVESGPDALAVAVPVLAGAAAGADSDAVWRRPEGPGAEEDFILLDLL